MNKRSVQDVRFSAPQPTLDVNEFVQRYVRKPLTKQVPVQQPTELGSMSRDSKRNWHIGSRAEFAKLKLPQSLPLDLNPGFTQFRQAYQESDPDSLALVLKSVESFRTNAGYRPDVVSWRGALRTILTTPYLLKDGYELGVWKRNGVLYVQTRKYDPRPFEDMDEEQQRYMYYGYKFEQVCTDEQSATTAGEAVPDPVSCYSGVFKSKIGSTRVLFGAEVDAYEANGAHVELKVTKQIVTDRDRFTFERYKLLKWYAQCFLAGTTKLVVGFRDQDGMLRKIESFETLKVPRLIRGREDRLWCASRSILFLENVLQWLRKAVPDDGGMYKMVYSSADRRIALHTATRLHFEEIDEKLYFGKEGS